MKSLLICATLALTAFGCSDVRVVDDDGPGSDGQGGSTSNAAGGGGGGPTATPAQARLFSKWHGTEDLHGFQVWNDPDQTGIDREPDGYVQISDYVRGFAVVGDRLAVYDIHNNLHFFDDVWTLTTGAVEIGLVDMEGSTQSDVTLRSIPELDWLWVPPRVFRSVSQIDATALAQEVTWTDPVYDVARDRLFVLQGDAVRVIDSASTSESLEPSWTLFEIEDEPVRNLISDGQSLFASGDLGLTEFGSHNVLVWPLDVGEPSPPGDLDANTNGFVALAPIPGGGVVAMTNTGIWAWDNASPTFQDMSGWDVQTGALWQALAVSQAARIYACGEGIWVYADPSLDEPIATADAGGPLLLIER